MTIRTQYVSDDVGNLIRYTQYILRRDVAERLNESFHSLHLGTSTADLFFGFQHTLFLTHKRYLLYKEFLSYLTIMKVSFQSVDIM